MEGWWGKEVKREISGEREQFLRRLTFVGYPFPVVCLNTANATRDFFRCTVKSPPVRLTFWCSDAPRQPRSTNPNVYIARRQEDAIRPSDGGVRGVPYTRRSCMKTDCTQKAPYDREQSSEAKGWEEYESDRVGGRRGRFHRPTSSCSDSNKGMHLLVLVRMDFVCSTFPSSNETGGLPSEGG